MVRVTLMKQSLKCNIHTTLENACSARNTRLSLQTYYMDLIRLIHRQQLVTRYNVLVVDSVPVRFECNIQFPSFSATASATAMYLRASTSIIPQLINKDRKFFFSTILPITQHSSVSFEDHFKNISRIMIAL